MIWMYVICLLFSFAMLFWLKIADVRNSAIQFVTVLIIAISNLGYYFLATATNPEEAVLAQKIAYVGGVFLPVFYFLMVLEICHIRIPRRLSIPMLLIQCVLFLAVCSIGKNGLYYKAFTLHTIDGISCLEKEYGPLHFIYPATMFIYLGASFAAVFYSIAKNKSVSRRGLWAIILFAALAVGVYILEKALHLKFEIIPIGYVILIAGALIPVYESNLFTVYENIGIVHEKLNQIGFITFDRHGNYMGCNTFIARVFPELADYHVGEKIEDCSQELQNLLHQISVLEVQNKSESARQCGHVPLNVFSLGERYYDGMIHTVTNAFHRVRGHTVEIRDDTEHYAALRLKERYNEELSSEVQEKTLRIREIQRKTVLGMAQMVESRDLSTGGHIKRTSDVVEIFSKRLLTADMGFDKTFLNLVIRSAPMHDLGKIGVDDVVLRKQGRYTDVEYEEMKKHSEIGCRMVRQILADVEEPDFVRIAGNVAHYHHEKMDGSGYPAHLKGAEIPVEARIMALADVFDALVSKRCYKEAFSFDKAFSIIRQDSGTHFDQELAEVFLQCRQELEEYYLRDQLHMVQSV